MLNCKETCRSQGQKTSTITILRPAVKWAGLTSVTSKAVKDYEDKFNESRMSKEFVFGNRLDGGLNKTMKTIKDTMKAGQFNSAVQGNLKRHHSFEWFLFCCNRYSFLFSSFALNASLIF